MNWELIIILVIVSVILIYALKHLPKAINDLRKELGE